MPALDRSDGDIEVLVTGFGPFGSFESNPSWLCTRSLHNVRLALDHAPSSFSSSASESDAAQPSRRSIHVQVCQTSVAYSHILNLVPHIHGTQPSAPESKIYLDPRGQPVDSQTGEGAQGNGEPFPNGYRSICVPAKGYFDHVVHVGVGSMGAIALETLAHKRGYQLPDVKRERAPIATDQSSTKRREEEQSTAERREAAHLQKDANAKASEDRIRGFGVGYEQFKDEQHTTNDVAALARWLTDERGHKFVRTSADPGRFLCDFIFYCSLCEAQRTGNPTSVQFIHVPPSGAPFSSDECHVIVRDAIWWLAAHAATAA